MGTKHLFETALHIQEPWFIKDIQFDSEGKRLDIYIDFKKDQYFITNHKKTISMVNLRPTIHKRNNGDTLTFLTMNATFMPECQESRLVRPK